MKKILFILSVALLTVGCNDKEEFTPAKGATPINVSLTYDNASSFANNAMNRTLIYEQLGQQIKLSIVADDNDAKTFYLSAAVLDETKDTQLLDCEITEVDYAVNNIADINIASIPDDGAFQGQVLLPETTELQEKEEEDDPNVWEATEVKGYIVRYVAPEEGGKNIYFAVTVNSLSMTETVTETVIDSPYEEDDEPFDTIIEKTYSVTADISYKQFNSNGWLN